jgi:carbon-monoxide dehydrogenase small subunit
MSKSLINIVINKDKHEVAVSAHETLQDVLRDTLHLTGTKRGCVSGSCGVCTVIDDQGNAVFSCLTLALDCEDRAYTTIEGIAEDGELHPVQKSFLEYGAVQCGYCTPGLLMTAKALYDSKIEPSVEEVNEALAGILCRCTGHIKVKEAMLNAWRFARETKPDDA